jgi:hypothetical protein
MSTLSELTESLLLILEEELGLMSELAELIQEKNPLLVKSDIEGLEEILSKEDRTAFKLRNKDAERQKYAEQMALILGVSPKECRLKTLIEHMDDSITKQKLSDIRYKLRLAAQKLSRINRKASALTKQKAAYIDYLINLLCDYPPKNRADFYDIKGKMNESISGSRRLDYTV